MGSSAIKEAKRFGGRVGTETRRLESGVERFGKGAQRSVREDPFLTLASGGILPTLEGVAQVTAGEPTAIGTPEDPGAAANRIASQSALTSDADRRRRQRQLLSASTILSRPLATSGRLSAAQVLG
jgi:hypothetical protein